MGKDKELHRELVEVTKESMEAFINQYPLFANGLQIWIEQRAAELDLKALNHFQRLSMILLEGAIMKIQNECKDAEIH